ncbi:MAG TPA: hypothetical protein VLA00_17985 [Xanthobacteraceae bacterium]|nr:hypothetical protein [Xanthobacteraceae bacterium]
MKFAVGVGFAMLVSAATMPVTAMALDLTGIDLNNLTQAQIDQIIAEQPAEVLQAIKAVEASGQSLKDVKLAYKSGNIAAIQDSVNNLPLDDITDIIDDLPPITP